VSRPWRDGQGCADRTLKAWDPRILELHVQHNLVPLPSSPNGTEVTLAMSKFREAAAFANSWSGAIGRAAGRERKHATKIHTVVMTESNLGNAEQREIQLREIASWGAGHSAAELKAGHLIAQEHPEMLGESVMAGGLVPASLAAALANAALGARPQLSIWPRCCNGGTAHPLPARARRACDAWRHNGRE
jgi:hypothetical protein